MWTTPVPSSVDDEVGAEDLEGALGAEALGVGEEVEQRAVAATDQLGARQRRHRHGRLAVAPSSRA